MQDRWIDRQTRAVFVLLALYSPSDNRIIQAEREREREGERARERGRERKRERERERASERERD